MGKDVCWLSLSVDHWVAGGDTRLTHLTPAILSLHFASVRNKAGPRPPHLAVGKVVDLLADEADVRFGLVVRGAPGNIAVGLGQT